jgi:hypothetical protein
MNKEKRNNVAIINRMALAAVGTLFISACKNGGLTLNVIVFLLIYIAMSITSD